MKSKTIAAAILTAIMAISAMPMAVSARNVDSTNVRGKRDITIKTSTGTKVGYGTIDFGTASEPGAYGMAQRSSSAYARAAVKLISMEGKEEVFGSDWGISADKAYAFIPVSKAADTVKGKWAVCGERVVSGDPIYIDSYNWIV